jgi:lipoate-protein ligase B
MPDLRDWGRREYGASLHEMRALVRARRSGEIPDTLILVEHPPVVTVGVEGDDGGAARSGFPVVAIERGGHATYHGPGQLVGYPIVDLDARGRDVRRFVRDLEELVAAALAPFGLRGEHVPGQPGVWIERSRKVASIGIAVDHWVTLHGFAINVDLDLGAFLRFQPCAMPGDAMTSIARELGRPVALAEVSPALVAAWGERFGPAVPAPTEPAASAPGVATRSPA